MVVIQNSSSVSDNSSDQNLSSDELNVMNFAKHMLKGKIFMGTYTEKRLIDVLGTYRDVVVINNSETTLTKDLNVVCKRIRDAYPTEWVGYTTPNTVDSLPGHCLWVELQEELYGSYWFKIKSVKFRKNEILLQLKQVRPIHNENPNGDTSNINLNVTELQEEFVNKIKYLAAEFYKILTYHNIKETIIFLFILMATLITFCFELLKYLGDFSLRLMREMSIFLNSATPVFISIIKMFEKIVGGFYILLAMIWRDSKRPSQPAPPKYDMLEYSNVQRGSKVYIRELN